MNSISSIARSGLAAAQLTLDSSAHNIANQATPAFRRQSVALAEQQGGGVTASVVRASEPGELLASDMVTQKMALYSFKANIKVIQTDNDMLGSLLDLRA